MTVNDGSVVSRNDWVNGLVPCPSCGLRLDKGRDHGEFVWDDWDVRATKALGVTGTHARCGTPFRLHFEDVPTSAIRRATSGRRPPLG